MCAIYRTKLVCAHPLNAVSTGSWLFLKQQQSVTLARVGHKVCGPLKETGAKGAPLETRTKNDRSRFVTGLNDSIWMKIYKFLSKAEDESLKLGRSSYVEDIHGPITQH